MSDLFKSKTTRPTTEKKLSGVNWAPETKRGNVYQQYSKPIRKAFTGLPIQMHISIQKGAGLEKSYYLEGIASDNKIDWDGDRATEGFLHSLTQQINTKNIPLMFGHSNIRLGVLAGSMLSNGQVLLRSKLDDDNPAAQEILRRMTERGESFGYSIGGTGYGRILPDRRRELTQIDLKEVSVVEIPANPRAKITAVVKKDD